MAATLSFAQAAPMYANESRYELIKQLRNKMYTFSVLGFPLMFYLLFGVANRHATYDGFQFAKYLVAAYCVFGTMGSSLFGVGVGFAIERGNGWLDLKRASPMPPAALLAAKCFSAMCFALLVSCALMALGALTAGVKLEALQCLRLLGVVAAATIPFAALGLMVSFLLSATAAPGFMNLIYLPMSFCSGVWIPIQQLPKFVQHIAPFLPMYHVAQLAFRAFGYGGDTMSTGAHWAAVAGFTAVFVSASALLYNRSNSRA